MKNITKLFAIAVVILGFATSSFAQPLVSGAADARGEIVGNLSVAKTGDMAFGKFTKSGAGTVVLTNAGAVSATGLVTILTGATSAAKFTVSGIQGDTYGYSYPPSIILTNESGGVGDITIVATLNAPTAAAGTIGDLSLSNNQVINMGATLTIDGGELLGVYSNTADLKFTVSYP